jgi:uncharacterized protein YkwD
MSAAPTVPGRRKVSRRRSVVIAAVLGCLVVVLSACTPESWAALDLINGSRAQNHRAPVAFNMDLWFKAQSWSDHMAGYQTLSHSNLADGMGGVPWRKLGENIAIGYDLGAIQNAFMNSTGHRNNILDPAFNYSAVGVSGDPYGRYWVVQEFMQM